MKKKFLTIAAILTLLLSGCQANHVTDISTYCRITIHVLQLNN